MVRKYSIFTNDYELYVYGVKTDDIFHTMGEISYRSDTQVQRINFVVLTPENRQAKFNFWEKENKKIYEWKDKYKCGVNDKKL